MNLVDDLRSRGWRQQGKPPCGGILMAQAADRIEELERAVATAHALLLAESRSDGLSDELDEAMDWLREVMPS